MHFVSDELQLHRNRGFRKKSGRKDTDACVASLAHVNISKYLLIILNVPHTFIEIDESGALIVS